MSIINESLLRTENKTKLCLMNHLRMGKSNERLPVPVFISFAIQRIKRKVSQNDAMKHYYAFNNRRNTTKLHTALISELQ